MNTHQQQSDLATLWGQIMIEPKNTACHVDKIITCLNDAGTDIDDPSAVIMRLIHSGFHSSIITRDMDNAVRQLREFRRSAMAAFDAHFPTTTNSTGAN